MAHTDFVLLKLLVSLLDQFVAMAWRHFDEYIYDSWLHPTFFCQNEHIYTYRGQCGFNLYYYNSSFLCNRKDAYTMLETFCRNRQ